MKIPPPKQKNPTLLKTDEIEAVLAGMFDMRIKGGNLRQKAVGLSVTPEEIRAHVKQFGWPEGVTLKTEPGSSDDTYLVKTGDIYELYSQERGIKSGVLSFATYDEAISSLTEAAIDFYLHLKNPKKYPLS